MIGSGRDIPVVRAEETFVEVILSAGKPDVGFITMLHELEGAGLSAVLSSVDTLIVLKHLWDAPRISRKQVELLTQVSALEAAELMEALQEYRVVKRLRDSDEWVAGEALAEFVVAPDNGDPVDLPAVDWLEGKLAMGETVYAAEAAEKLGMERSIVTEMLRKLRQDGVAQIDPSGPQRGPRTRWVGVETR